MGDPKRSRRQYQAPTHPWEGERIKNEDEYVRKYGLKNKKEFWKAESLLRAQRAQARQYLPLVMRDDPQGKKEADQLVGKLNRLGLLQKDANLGDVLALDVDAVLSRRLQTVTYLKGLAATPNQARQFITHGHIAIGGRRVDVPGYLVRREEEQEIAYAPSSPLLNEAHPLRQAAGGGTTTAEQAAEEIAEEVEAELETDEPDDSTEAEDAGEEDAEADDAEEEEAKAEDAEEEQAEPDASDEEEAEAGDEPEPEAEEADEPEEAEAEEGDGDETKEADAE